MVAAIEQAEVRGRALHTQLEMVAAVWRACAAPGAARGRARLEAVASTLCSSRRALRLSLIALHSLEPPGGHEGRGGRGLGLGLGLGMETHEGGAEVDARQGVRELLRLQAQLGWVVSRLEVILEAPLARLARLSLGLPHVLPGAMPPTPPMPPTSTPDAAARLPPKHGLVHGTKHDLSGSAQEASTPYLDTPSPHLATEHGTESTPTPLGVGAHAGGHAGGGGGDAYPLYTQGSTQGNLSPAPRVAALDGWVSPEEAELLRCHSKYSHGKYSHGKYSHGKQRHSMYGVSQYVQSAVRTKCNQYGE